MALEDYLSEFTTSSVDIWGVVIAIILSAVLGLILSEVYRKFGRSLSNRSKFAMLFPPIAMTTALIISVVKSSLALSLGLVGALSIIRFRTAIKEPEELGYLFLTISVGLGMGASLYFLTTVSFVMISAIIVFISYGRSTNELGINFLVKSKKLKATDVSSVLGSSKCDFSLRRSNESGEGNEFAFFISDVSVEKLSAMSDKLKDKDSGVEVSYYEAQVGV